MNFSCVCALNNFDSDTQELSGLDKLVGAIVRGTSGEVDVGLEANAVIKVSYTCVRVGVNCTSSVV